MAFTSLELGGPAFPAGARGLFSSGGLLRALLGADNAGPSTEEAQARSRATCRWCSGRAPPVLQATTPTAEYTCGNCDAVLIPADEDKILALIIHCTACGWYNSTGV